jgi:hypothetical protein
MLNINYFFGTGGFYALWILLLGTPLRCNFNDLRDLDTIYQEHWNIAQIDEWKKTEIWPVNDGTSDIQFTCNPTHFISADKQIVIYTDIQTHLKLASAKRAGPFIPGLNSPLIVDVVLKPYNDIKGEHWPDIKTFEQLNTLETYQKKELEENTIFKFYDNIVETYAHLVNVPWKGKKIYFDYKKGIDIDQADIYCDLLDIIKTNGGCLLEPLGYRTNQKCIDFTKMYVHLNKGLL